MEWNGAVVLDPEIQPVAGAKASARVVQKRERLRAVVPPNPDGCLTATMVIPGGQDARGRGKIEQRTLSYATCIDGEDDVFIVLRTQTKEVWSKGGTGGAYVWPHTEVPDEVADGVSRGYNLGSRQWKVEVILSAMREAGDEDDVSVRRNFCAILSFHRRPDGVEQPPMWVHVFGRHDGSIAGVKLCSIAAKDRAGDE